MSYESVVLAKNPILFLRLDMVGTPVDHDVVPDVSASGLDGIQRVANTSNATELPGTNPWGRSSPIESDVSSRAVRLWNNDGLTPFQSYIYVPHNAVFDLPTDFTVNAWLKTHTSFGAVSTGRVGIGGSYSIGLTFSSGFRFCGFVTDSAGTLFSVVATGIDAADSTWRMITVVRSGSNLFIYVNGIFWNQTVLTSGLPNQTTTNDFKVHFQTLAGHAGFYDEVALFNTALTTPDIKEIYDAAFLSSSIGVTIAHRHTLSFDSAPEVIPAFFPFRHNWESPIRESVTYNTSLLPSRNGNEQAYSTIGKARRILTYDLVLPDEYERARFQSRLWKTASEYISLIPELQEKVLINDDYPSGTDTIVCQHQYRNFEVGQKAAYMKFSNGFKISEYEEVTIAELNGTDEIVFEDVSEDDWTGPFYFIPLKRAEIIKPLRISGMTGKVDRTQIQANVLLQDTPTIPHRTTTFTPPGTYRGEEAFNPFIWTEVNNDDKDVEFSVVDDVVDFRTGLWINKQVQQGANTDTTYQFLVRGRELISKFFGWLDYRCGMQKTFWMPTLRHDFQYVSKPATNKIKVREISYDNYNLSDARRDIAIINPDKTLTARRINASVNNGDGTETLTLSGDLSSTVYTAALQICFYQYSRLNHDKIEWEWLVQPDDAILVSLIVRSLLITP